MKISRRPTTSGGSSRQASTPASHSRGAGNRPRAIIHASGVPRQTRTERVIAPASRDTTSGLNAPGVRSALLTVAGVTWKNKAMTGPSSATQITAAPVRDSTDDAERSAGARPAPDAWPGSGAGLTAQLILAAPAQPGQTPDYPSSRRIGAGTALAAPETFGVSSTYPSFR